MMGRSAFLPFMRRREQRRFFEWLLHGISGFFAFAEAAYRRFFEALGLPVSAGISKRFA